MHEPEVAGPRGVGDLLVASRNTKDAFPPHSKGRVRLHMVCPPGLAWTSQLELKEGPHCVSTSTSYLFEQCAMRSRMADTWGSLGQGSRLTGGRPGLFVPFGENGGHQGTDPRESTAPSQGLAAPLSRLHTDAAPLQSTLR